MAFSGLPNECRENAATGANPCRLKAEIHCLPPGGGSTAGGQGVGDRPSPRNQHEKTPLVAGCFVTKRLFVLLGKQVF